MNIDIAIENIVTSVTSLRFVSLHIASHVISRCPIKRLVVRKPVIEVSDQVSHKPSCTATKGG